MVTTTAPEYEETLTELARAIRTRQPTYPPRETARELLRYDDAGKTALVGIDADATRAVLYHERDEYAIGVAFDSAGLEVGGPVLADFDEFGTSVYGWVRRMGTYWGWLHPRFR